MPPPLCSPVSVCRYFPFDLSLNVLLNSYSPLFSAILERSIDVKRLPSGNILPAQIVFRRVYFREEIISSLFPSFDLEPSILISFLLPEMTHRSRAQIEIQRPIRHCLIDPFNTKLLKGLITIGCCYSINLFHVLLPLSLKIVHYSDVFLRIHVFFRDRWITTKSRLFLSSLYSDNSSFSHKFH